MPAAQLQQGQRRQCEHPRTPNSRDTQQPMCQCCPHQKAGPEPHMTMGTSPLSLVPTGVSQLMRPQALGPVVRATAMLYFHLRAGCTLRHYEAAVSAFWQPPARPPTLVFYSHDDPLCDRACLQELLASWASRCGRRPGGPRATRPTCASTPWSAAALPPPSQGGSAWRPPRPGSDGALGSSLPPGEGLAVQWTRDRDRMAEALKPLDLFRLFNIQ